MVMSDFSDPLDPLGIGKNRIPENPPPEDISASLEPVIPENFGLPSPISIEEDKSNTLVHIGLREENVPEERRVELPEFNVPESATEKQRKLVQDAVKDVVLLGAQASAMICEGEACPYAKKCPLLRYNLPTPNGSECPIELYAMRIWMQAQMREMEINPHDVGSFYDVMASQAMTGLLLQTQRARWGEALNPILEQTMENIISQGNKTITTIVKTGNFNTDYRERALKQLEKMAKSNMQTRERKAALTKAGWKDKSKHAAEVSERLAEIREVEEKVSGVDVNGLPVALSRIKRFNVGTPDKEVD
jgi:predicted transcriptional regulator